MAHASPEQFSPCPSQTLVSSFVSSLSARPGGGLHCTIARQGLLAVYVAWLSLGVSPLLLFFVPAEGEAMCRNRLVLLASFVACPSLAWVQSALHVFHRGLACRPQRKPVVLSAPLFLESLATHSQGHSGCIRPPLLPFVWELLALVRYVDVLLICPQFWKEVGGSEERKSHKMSNAAAAV